ncbi:MAG: hypothetical protein ACAI35_12195 [Candidatus Methylacidiphilales bacterium]|nr:hypothetical protein [Candidatus Methylacidiphilales bacterium]
MADPPMGAGGCAEAGQPIMAPGAGVSMDGITTSATVFVCSLDQKPLKSFQRLLVFTAVCVVLTERACFMK